MIKFLFGIIISIIISLAIVGYGVLFLEFYVR